MSMAASCYCDYDPPEWITIRDVKSARKNHQCIECRAVILAGEGYEYVSGKWEGEHYTFHTCNLCLELREWATISVPCFCWSYSDFHEQVREMVADTAKLVPGFFMEYGRRMVKIRQTRRAREGLLK